MEPTEVRLDGKQIRTLAHPLRSRLLGRLRLDGPATATRLAEALGTNTGATSYHLRKLAEVGLVTETGEGTGKQRFWAPAQESHSWSEEEHADDPDAAAAAKWLRQHYVSHFAEKLARWEDEREHWPPAWREAASMSDALVTATPEELEELMTELVALVERFRENVGDEPRPGARRAFVQFYAMPADLDDRP